MNQERDGDFYTMLENKRSVQRAKGSVISPQFSSQESSGPNDL